MSLMEIRGLSKTYQQAGTRIEVLQGLDLQLEAGEIVAVVGQSGSGKSTFLSLVAGLDRPEAGSIHLDGRDLVRMNEVELAALFVLRDVEVSDVLDHLRHGRRLRVDAGALIYAWQEGGRVVGGAAIRQPTAAQCNEAREILVFGAKPVNEPRTHARLRDADRAGVHEHRRNFVRGDVRVH